MTARTPLLAFALMGLIGQQALTLTRAESHPEFQKQVQATSGRFVNCSLCHLNPDGPDGIKPGQIGSLSSEELEELGRARAAFEPGQDVHSPVLNDFGNLILKKVGKKELLLLRSQPDQLADRLDPVSDLDQDGIPDSRELKEGTFPLSNQHGNPWLLFRHNVGQSGFHVLMMLLATGFGLYGLQQVLTGMAVVTGVEGGDDHETM